MAFAIGNLGVLDYANGFTLWSYKTGDALAETPAPGYFNGAADMLSPGDIVLIVAGGVGSQAVVAHSGSRPPLVAMAPLVPFPAAE